MESLHVFRERLVCVALELLHLAIVLLQRSRQIDRGNPGGKVSSNIESLLLAALGRTQFDSLKYSSRADAEEHSQKVLAILASKLREYLV